MNRVLGERPVTDVVAPDLARTVLEEMVRARVFDERAVALQRRGWMSGYPPFRGQEASQVGAAHALADDDWLFPTYRSNAMQLARGRPMTDILRFRRGRSEFEPVDERADRADDANTDENADDPAGRPVDESAGRRRRGGRAFTQATPIATQLPHAVGAGLAADYRGADHAVCAYFGDGATSEGDFHEAMNFAGVFDAPVVFLCENNHWAISTPADRQTASESVAAKADAYGFEGVQVDGMDPVAVYETVAGARADAREGDPVLVESLTYRQGAHTTSDDPERYRGDVDLPEWRTGDPIERYADALCEAGVVDEQFVETAREAAEEAVADAVAAVEADPEPDVGDLFDHAYASRSPRLRAQERSLRDREGDGDPRDRDGDHRRSADEGAE